MGKQSLCRLLPVYLWCLLPCFGQTQISSADLKGRVTAPSDSIIAGATVSARNLNTNASRIAWTDESGEFGIFLLSPGEYEISAEAQGFQRQPRRITLTVGQIGILNLELRPGAPSIEVDVTDQGLPLLESGRTNPAATLTQRVIQGLPINGRNFLSFTLLSSGVVEESATVTNSLLPQLPTSRLIFAGQNGRSNSVTIDGVDNNDIAGNGVRPTIGQEAVQEFQINHHTYNAEFGRSSGGAINIVSKGGTNRFRGNFYDYFRHEKLDSPNSFATGMTKKPPFKRNQPGFTFGGPVKKDRTFFFTSYEGLFRRESAATAILSDPSILQPTAGQRDLIRVLENSGAADFQALGQTLDQLLTTSANSPFPAAGGPFPMNRTTFRLLTDSSGSFPIRQTTSNGTLRLDHMLTSRDQLLFRYNLTNDSQHGIGTGGLTAPSAGFDIAIHDHAFVFGENHVSNKTVNEFRFQFVREVFNVDTTDPCGPRIAIPGVGNFGRELIDPSDRTQHRYQWLDNFSYTRGKHYFKMGVDYNRYSFQTYSPVFTGGEIDFARLPIPVGAVLGSSTATQLVNALGQSKSAGGLDRPDLIPVITTEPLTIVQQVNFGLPALFNQGFGDPNAVLSGQMLGLYWQDSAQITRSLHLDFGARYDYEMQPEGVHRDPNNLAPRFGLAYVPSRDGKTVIRAGGGVYFQPLYTATAFSAKILGKNQQISNILVSASPDLTPVSGGSTCGIALASAGAPPSFCFFQELVARGLLTFPATRTIPESAYQQLAGLTRQTSTNKLAVRLEDNARDTYSVQSSAGIDRQLGRDWNISANYLFTRALRIIRVRQANALPNPDLLDPFGRPTLTRRLNPSLLADFVVETAGNSVYHGMTLDLNKRFSKHYQFIGSYTLGKAIDDTIDIQIPQGPQDPTNTRAEKSLSSFDTRHRISVAAIVESPFQSKWLADFSVAPILTVRSAFPFNITTGMDTNQDNNLNDRPHLVGRNTGRGANYFTADLRIARRFAINERTSMQLIVDGFNIFNRVNFKEVNGDTGGALRLSDLGFTDVRIKASSRIPASQLGGFTSAHDPRVVQVGLKVDF